MSLKVLPGVSDICYIPDRHIYPNFLYIPSFSDSHAVVLESHMKILVPGHFNYTLYFHSPSSLSLGMLRCNGCVIGAWVR